MKETTQQMKLLLVFTFLGCLLVSCSVQKRISRQAQHDLLDYKELASAHIGIAVFDVLANKYLYNYQGEKSFTPASNTKLFTLYAGMKYLGDSLVAARYKVEDGIVRLQATGDPTFLHPDFKNQPLLSFLQQKEIAKISINTAFAANSYGNGWAWEDYKEDYMAERDPFPMYGNMATVIFTGDTLQTIPPDIKPFVAGTPVKNHVWELNRDLGAHFFTIDTTRGTLTDEKKITMAMNKGLFASRYLSDTLHKEVTTDYLALSKSESIPVYSQPADSVFKIMMHRSDNFFAEQTLLMAADEKLGVMDDIKMIDTLLKSDCKDLPQKAKWADGSGLSRYNLFSPDDFIFILQKLKDEFGIERLKTILPGANEGTLTNLFIGYDKHIYAKTGSLSNNIALSGYLITKKNNTLIFSILINNHQASASKLRKQMEKFLISVINKY